MVEGSRQSSAMATFKKLQEQQSRTRYPRPALGTTYVTPRSELEERFLELCRDHGLPRPRVNHHVEGRERDFVFPGHRLVVETDGWRHHHSREAFEQDRLRDAELARAGYRTLRFTHRRLAEAPGEVAATVGAVLRSPARSSA